MWAQFSKVSHSKLEYGQGSIGYSHGWVKMWVQFSRVLVQTKIRHSKILVRSPPHRAENTQAGHCGDSCEFPSDGKDQISTCQRKGGLERLDSQWTQELEVALKQASTLTDKVDYDWRSRLPSREFKCIKDPCTNFGINSLFIHTFSSPIKKHSILKAY